MIVGQVNPKRHCLVPLEVRGPSGIHETVVFQLDTGFNGSLMLPLTTVERLGLLPAEEVSIRLANGERILTWYYAALVDWDGQTRSTRVVASGTQPLLGMSLALGHRIAIDMVDGGRVTITHL